MTFRVTNNGLHVADPEFTFLDSQLISAEEVPTDARNFILAKSRRVGYTHLSNVMQVMDRNISRMLERGLNEIYSN